MADRLIFLSFRNSFAPSSVLPIVQADTTPQIGVSVSASLCMLMVYVFLNGFDVLVLCRITVILTRDSGKVAHRQPVVLGLVLCLQWRAMSHTPSS